METPQTQISPELLVATETLAQNLAASQPFVLYQQARMRLDNDPAALSLLEQLLTLQANVRARQGRGAVNQAEVEQLRKLQNEAQSNAAIMAYAQTQENAIAMLREATQEINQLLGLDFAALTRRSGCC